MQSLARDKNVSTSSASFEIVFEPQSSLKDIARLSSIPEEKAGGKLIRHPLVYKDLVDHGDCNSLTQADLRALRTN